MKHRPAKKESVCSSNPRIVVVAQQIANLQCRRTELEASIEANDLRGEKLQTELDVVDSEQRTYEREMDSLTRSQIVRK